MKRIFLITFMVSAAISSAQTNNTPLTLDEALMLAMNKSKAGQLGRIKVDTAEAELQGARSLRYPQIRAYGAGVYLNEPLEVKVGQGSLTRTLNEAGPQLGLGPINVSEFPTSDLSLAKGDHVPVVGTLMVAQPLTQLWRIGSGVLAAEAGVAEARRESEHIDAKVRLAVEEVFVGLAVESRRRSEKEAMVAWQERRLRDAQTAQESGELLDETVLGLQAAVIQSRAELTRSRQEYARLSLQLADLIGNPGADDLAVVESFPAREEQPLDQWTAQAVNNPERMIAVATLQKATAGVRAARQAYIPEVSLVGGGFVQDGIPLAEKHNGLVGVTVSWDIFDFGRRRSEVSRADSLRRAAEVNRDRIEEDAARQIRITYQDLVYADEQIALARQAVSFRRRSAELAHQSVANGLALETAALEADAQLRKAETDLGGAMYQRHVALLHLHFLAGRL